MIYLRTTDRQTVKLLHNKSRTRADLIRFEHTINDETTFEVFSFFQLSAIVLMKSRQKIVCFANVYMYLLRLSSVKTTFHRLPLLLTSRLITFQWQMMSKQRALSEFHITGFLSIGSIGEVCLNYSLYTKRVFGRAFSLSCVVH